MPGQDGIPTPEELGSETPSEATPPAAEKPPVADPKDEPAAPPEKETPPQDEPQDEGFATVEDFANAVTESLDAIEQRKAARAKAEAEKADLSEDELRIRALEAENQQLKEKEQNAAIKAQEDKIVHQVQSCAGKYKMTDEEVEVVGEFFKQNPALIGVWSFERGSLYVIPELQGRLSSAPPAQPKAPGSDSKTAGVVDGTTSGPATPQPFKHDGRRRDYTDVSKSVLSNPGELAGLGKYV